MAEHRTLEALSEIHPKGKESEGDDEERESEKGEEVRERVSEPPCVTESRSSEPPDEAEPRESNLETLVVLDQRDDFLGSSSTYDGDKAESKERVEPPVREIEAVQEPPTETANQLQVATFSNPLSKPSPTSVAQSLSSAPSPTAPKQKMSPPKGNNVDVPELDKKTLGGGKTLAAVSVARTSASDGYNWRKYGQKQVKSPTGSRSYYRCTHSDCCAKKIECCDHSGQVIEIVYKSEHSHDPPRKTNSTRECKFVSSNESTVENCVPKRPVRMLNDSDPSPPLKEPQQEAPCITDKKRQNSSNVSENGKDILKEEHLNELEPKRRMKKDDLIVVDSPVKSGKKPKLVVHAAGDVSMSGDGYRWRKYGQKMVKGNPHPRNYYRCTSAGCPVRKHIETAVDNSDAVVITYKGLHDHDMPVPKKRHGPPSAPLVAAAAPASMNNSQLKKTDSPQNQKISTQWSVDTEGELTGESLDLGGEKAMESARTLLSIGFEIKPC